MPRIARFLKEDEPTVYHVISRTALERENGDRKIMHYGWMG